MAIKKSITLPTGIDVTDAYHRVENVNINKSDMTFQVRAYASIGCAACFDTSYSCSYSLSGANPVEQAYEYMKSLPEFHGATDC